MPRSIVFASLLMAGSFVACTLDRAGLNTEGAGGATSTATGGGSTTSSGGSTAMGGEAPQGGASTTSTGGGGAGPEDCLNGVDDNGDGLADCEDPNCMPGYACVPMHPNAAHVAPIAAPQNCPSDAPATTVTSCGDCGCTEVPGTCTLQIDFFTEDTSTCGGSSISLSSPANCNNGPDGQRSVEITANAPNADTECTIDAATVTTKATSLCEASSVGTCANPAEVCVPKLGDVCVLMPPGEACGGAYPVSHGRFFDGSVTSCDCDCAENASCSPVVEVSTANNCSSVTAVALNAGCTALGDISAVQIPAQPSTVSCEPSATPTGGATAQGLCCTN